MSVGRIPSADPLPTATSISGFVSPTMMPRSTIAVSRICSRLQNRIGSFATGTSCLALVDGIGRHRVSAPPARNSAVANVLLEAAAMWSERSVHRSEERCGSGPGVAWRPSLCTLGQTGNGRCQPSRVARRTSAVMTVAMVMRPRVRCRRVIRGSPDRARRSGRARQPKWRKIIEAVCARVTRSAGQ